MILKEAYNILNVDENISDDDLKKAYKSLSKKYHPDIFKEDPDKFKHINEAYQAVMDHRQNPHKYQDPRGDVGFSHINIQDLFGINLGGSIKQRVPHHPPPTIDINISFKQSILGHEQNILYKRLSKCEKCDGAGLERTPNGCKNCNGFGRVVSNTGNMMFTQSCAKCMGRNVKTNKCPTCAGKATIETEINGHINIPAGIPDKTTLRLSGAGNYQGNHMFGDSYSDVYVNVSVEKDPDLKLVGSDVVSNLHISLLEALTGITTKVRTVHDERQIEVKPKSKNKDEILINDCGVKGTPGVQKVLININYPNDTDSLINFLKG